MNAYPFSPAGRQAALAAMAGGPVDLLIIGGGITGAGLARDAVLRGLRVALVEQHDFAYGTSSRSSKLVHGGVRYLAQLNLALVRESARERKVLSHIAPHLVHPLPCLLPVYPGESLAKYQVAFFLLDQLAGAGPGEAHAVLPGEAVATREPMLRRPVRAGLTYGEFITDDSRLTLENALSAALHGALVVNHAMVTAFRSAGERITGAMVCDTLSGREYSVTARVVVNATGPWAAATLAASGLPTPKRLLLSKGIHLLFAADRLPVTGGVMLHGPDGREGFAIRRWQYTYVGTTDVAHPEAIDAPQADAAAIADLLRLVEAMFPGAGLTADDVLATWAGLRPLIAEPGKSARDTSRHDAVWRIRPGLLTVAGGKLTTYRPMAARIMARVAAELGERLGDNGRTATVLLPGGDLGAGGYAGYQRSMLATLAHHGIAGATAERLTWLYGTWLDELLAYGEAWLQPLAPGFPALRGEVRLAVERGMALELADFMDRRAALLLFSPGRGLAAAPEAARVMAGLLGWSEAERERQLAAYRALAKGHGLPAELATVPAD